VNRKAGILICGLILLHPLEVEAQEPFPDEDQDIPTQILSFFSPFVIPKIFQDVHLLREYIRTEEFAAVRGVEGDLCAVDRIFLKSLEITWSNYYESLLICTWAVMDHRNVGIDLPIIGSLFWFPLTSEFPEEFHERVKNLPVRLYPDSPAHAGGDRDKLQHFFGSAFLQILTESTDGAERVGNIVEYGEASFIVGGRHDDRDLRANQQGRSFGEALQMKHRALPSDFLLLVVASSENAPQTRLCGGEVSGLWEE
jgi:hypothetical protein